MTQPDDIFAACARKRANAIDAARRASYAEMRRKDWARKLAQATATE